VRNCIKALSYLLASMSFFASEMAHAEAACSYSVSSLTIGPDSTVSASFTGYGYTRNWVLCSVSNSWGSLSNGGATFTFTPDACRAVYSQLLTARASARNVTATFGTLSSCGDASIPASGVPSPYPYAFTF
jgi:hypothetical protein